MAETFTLGPCPAEEDTAQLGRTPDFDTLNFLEVDCYQAALIARYGPPPPASCFKRQVSHHDFGRYCELALPVDERRIWGEMTVRQLRRAIGPRHRGPVIFLAGRLYREPLLDFAGERAVIPMAGMGIGQQKAWLAAQIVAGRERALRAA